MKKQTQTCKNSRAFFTILVLKIAKIYSQPHISIFVEKSSVGVTFAPLLFQISTFLIPNPGSSLDSVIFRSFVDFFRPNSGGIRISKLKF